MNKLYRYITERAKWKKLGKPLRSEQQIENIFKICEQCKLFKRYGPDDGECGECGCRLKRSGTFLNKISWATTHCPLLEPKWEETEARYKDYIELSESDLDVAEIEHQQDLSQSTENKNCGCK